MSLAAFFFYVFASLTVLAGAMVIVAKNPVHAVLFLILAFFNAAGLFILLGAEFLAMLLVIVYVGAVAVLFLFVVMMLDIDFAQLREGFQRYAPVGALIGGVLFLQILLAVGVWQSAPAANVLRLNPIEPGVENTRAIGRVLYTDYVFLFQASGLVLLVAMIGAIVLTLRERPGTRRQDVATQIARAGSVNLRSIPTGAGLRETGVERPPLPEPEAPKPERIGHGGGHH